MVELGLDNINVSERLNSLIKRRGVELKGEFGVKERGKLRTSKWFKLELPLKSSMHSNLKKNLYEL